MDDGYWWLVCWKAYLAAWKLFKKHSKEIPVNWEAVHEEARKIREQYPSRLCEDVLLAVIGELERHREG